MKTSEMHWLALSTHRERQTTVITPDSKPSGPHCAVTPPWEASERGHAEPKTWQVGRAHITGLRSDKKHCPLPLHVASSFLPAGWLRTTPAGSAGPRLVVGFTQPSFLPIHVTSVGSESSTPTPASQGERGQHLGTSL